MITNLFDQIICKFNLFQQFLLFITETIIVLGGCTLNKEPRNENELTTIAQNYIGNRHIAAVALGQNFLFKQSMEILRN